MRLPIRIAAAGLCSLSLTACATLGGSSPEKALLSAETAFNVAATAERDFCPDGVPKTAQCAHGDLLRHQAYSALLVARAAYKVGKTPDVASILALTGQLTALFPPKGS